MPRTAQFHDGHEIRVRASRKLQERLAFLAKRNKRTASDMLRILVDEAYDRATAADMMQQKKPETEPR